MVTMERMGSYCLTEPGSGSDAAALKTKAVQGRRPLCRQRLQGVHLGRRRERDLRDHGPHRRGGAEGHQRAGHRKGHAGRQLRRAGEEARLAFAADRQVNFDEVRVPAENLVGAEGEGFRIAMMGLDGGRLNIGACSLGGAQRCLDEAIATPRSASSSARRSPTSRRRSSRSPTWRPSCRRRAMLLYAPRQGDRERARQDALRRHGQAARDRHRLLGGRPRAAAPRRLRLSAGLSDRALLARPSRPLDPGRHQPDHARDRRRDMLRQSRERGRGRDERLAARPRPSCSTSRWKRRAVGRLLDQRADRQGERKAARPALLGAKTWQDDPLLPGDPRFLPARVEAASRDWSDKPSGDGSNGAMAASCSTNI
jgi:hypothetical protein